MVNSVDISVIMPVFNVERYLDESLNSILNQSFKNIEVICVNDGSRDNSLNILKKFKEQDNRVIILNQSNNGAGNARNNGLKYAKGKYVYFMDADDKLKFNALKELYDLSEEKNLDIILFKLLNMDNDTKETYKHDYYEMDFLRKVVRDKIFNAEDVKNYVFNISVSPPGKLFKRELIQDIKFPEGTMFEDNLFFTKALFKAKRIYFYDKYLYYRRIRQNSVSFLDTGRYTDSIIILNQMEDMLIEEGIFEKYSFAWFSKKINIEHYRFTLVDKEHKEKFYNKMRDDFLQHKTRYESNPNFEKIDERLKRIYYSVITYTSYKDFELSYSNKIKYVPKISVIVPVYNAEKFLDESISSLLNQTFRDFEVLCVNDGSKDKSLEMLNRFNQIDPRIIVIDKPNGGCGSARNKGLDLAKGEYIYFFDPDDYILPNTFEQLYSNVTKNKSDLAIFKIARFKEGEPVDYSVPGFDFDNIFKNQDFDNFTFNYKDIKPYVLNKSFAPWCKLYKRNLIESNNLRFSTNVAFDDAPFHVQTILKAKKISFINDFFYLYRFNPNSVNNTSSNGIDIFKICDIIEDFLIKNDYFDEFKNEFDFFKLIQIVNYFFSTNTEEYFQKSKIELLNLNVEDNPFIKEDFISKIELLINCNSLNEYLKKYYNEEINQLLKENKDIKSQNLSLNSELTKIKKLTNDKEKKIHNLTETNKLLKTQIENLSKEKKKLKEINTLMANSNSWKVTQPLRKLNKSFKK